MEGHNEAFLEPSFLQAEQLQLSQPVFIGEVLYSLDNLHGLSGPSVTGSYLSCAVAPKVDTALQGKSHEGRVERQNALPWPAGHAVLDTSQDTTGFLGCQWILLDPVELLVHNHPQIFLHRPLKELISQAAILFRIALTRYSTLHLDLLNLIRFSWLTSQASPGPPLWLVSLWSGTARKICYRSSSLWKICNTWWFRAASETVVFVWHWCCNQFLRTKNNSKYGKVTHNGDWLKKETLMVTS